MKNSKFVLYRLHNLYIGYLKGSLGSENLVRVQWVFHLGTDFSFSLRRFDDLKKKAGLVDIEVLCSQDKRDIWD